MCSGLGEGKTEFTPDLKIDGLCQAYPSQDTQHEKHLHNLTRLWDEPLI